VSEQGTCHEFFLPRRGKISSKILLGARAENSSKNFLPQGDASVASLARGIVLPPKKLGRQ
jgi:hypothetical protein